MATTPAQTFAPCDVVVDSRNAHGMARRAFGMGVSVSVPGVRSALTRSGLSVNDVFVGTATRTLHSSPSEKVKRATAANLRSKEQWQADGAIVLEGTLADRDEGHEEKQVDVLLALTVAELAFTRPMGCAIAVVSEDMDLLPALELAQRHGVRTFACGGDTVFRRGSSGWVLFDTAAVRELCPKGGASWEVRRYLASRVTAWADSPVKWRMVKRLGSKRFLMENNRNVLGIWETSQAVPRGQAFELHAVGLTLDSPRTIPLVTLAETKPAGPPTSVVAAHVVAWMDSTHVKVQFSDDRTQRVAVPAGEKLCPGQSVWLHTLPAGGHAGWYYVGPAELNSSSSWELPQTDRVATITCTSNRKWLRAEVAGVGEIRVLGQHVHDAAPGGRVLVSPAGLHRETGVPLAMPMSSCL